MSFAVYALTAPIGATLNRRGLQKRGDRVVWGLPAIALLFTAAEP
ncbi:hypothetical protein [Candidatus Palauibacter sp.]